MTLTGQARRATGRGPAAGFVLVAVLIIVLLASMVALSLLFRVKAEQTATAASTSGDQAWFAAMSGVQEAIRVARQAGRDPMSLLNNPGAFRNREMYHDGVDRWYFTVYSAPLDEEAEGPRYGLTDEAGKLSLNRASAAALERLPRLTPSLAQGILDFADADNLPRPEGAEQEYYDALPRPYLVHNHPFSSVDELLLVRGITPQLLFGEDANSNCRLDPNEDDGEVLFPMDNKDGRLDLGLAPLLTVAAYEFDNDSRGRPRTNINNPESRLPEVELPQALTNFIAALRRGGQRIRHAVDLLDMTASLPGEGGAVAEMASGVGKDELPLVLDHFSTTDSARVEGLININTAPKAVLMVLPGMDEATADSIISTRRSLAPDRSSTIAWLLQEGVLDADRLKQVAPLITARGFQFSFRVVGFGVPSGRYRVLEVLVDAAVDPAVLLKVRDITRLGLPFPVDTEEQGGIADHGKPTEGAARG